MKEEKKFIVYCHTNKINNKKYIGITSCSVNRRWDFGRGYRNQSYFFNAINKYGWDNFEHEIMFEKMTKKEACEKEIELIKLYNLTNRENGYNISSGGTAPCGEDSPNFGKKQSKETIEKRFINRRGKNSYQAKKIICLNTLEEFDCIIFASRKYDIPDSNIYKCCIGERNHAGKINRKNALWMFYNEYINFSKNEIEEIINEKINKEIICLETNEVFNDFIEAEKIKNIPRGNIKKCCDKKRKTAGGFSWGYYKEE